MTNLKKDSQQEKQEKRILEDFYKPSQDVQEFIYEVYNKFVLWRTRRNQPRKEYNNKTLLDFIKEARKKFWGYIPVGYDSDTPSFFFPETRNQIITILAKVANLKMKPRFDGVEGFDTVKSLVLKDFVEYWKRQPGRKLQNFWQFLYAVINGTVIVYTAYKNKKKDVKNITMYNPETGETSYKTDSLDESDVEDELLNIEDVYIPKLWEPDIQKQGEAIVRSLMRWEDFKSEFGKYPNFNFVIPGSQFSDDSIFSKFISFEVKADSFVEVLRYFDSIHDRYAILANGVLLNPIKRDKKEEISPLPWNHKKLPLSKTVYEPMGAKLFYGMPLAQKVKSPQDALNKMWELMLRREQRSIAAPIITTDPSVEFGMEFKAGNIYQVNTDVAQYKELPVGQTSPSYWNALTTLQGIIQRTGSGGVGPVLPTVQPRSATERAQTGQQQKENAGLYFLFYQDLLEQKAWLTLKNMIQFYTSAKTERILGRRKFYKILSLSEINLLEGGIGNREIRITDEPLSPEELFDESYMRSLLKKERVEIIEVTPEALQQIGFDIKIDFEQEQSPENERLIFLDFLHNLMGMFGQTGLLSPKKMLYRTLEKFGESISDYVDDKFISDYEKERFGITTEKPVAEGTMTPSLSPADQGPEGAKAATPLSNFNQTVRGRMMGAAGPGQRMQNEGITKGNILKNF